MATIGERNAQIVQQALKYWNASRGYQGDGSDFPEGISFETMERYEVEEHDRLCQLLKAEWLERGFPLHPK